MGSGGMPTLMEKEIKDKIQFLTFSYFSSGQPKNSTNSLSQRHRMSTIDCLGTLADGKVHLGALKGCHGATRRGYFRYMGLPRTVIY